MREGKEWDVNAFYSGGCLDGKTMINKYRCFPIKTTHVSDEGTYGRKKKRGTRSRLHFSVVLCTPEDPFARSPSITNSDSGVNG